MGSKRQEAVSWDSTNAIEVTECKEDSLAIKIVKVWFKMSYWRIYESDPTCAFSEWMIEPYGREWASLWDVDVPVLKCLCIQTKAGTKLILTKQLV